MESSRKSRYHIGESLIPSVRRYLRFIGAEEKLVNHGFINKVRYPMLAMHRILIYMNSRDLLSNSISSKEKDVCLTSILLFSNPGLNNVIIRYRLHSSGPSK